MKIHEQRLRRNRGIRGDRRYSSPETGALTTLTLGNVDTPRAPEPAGERPGWLAGLRGFEPDVRISNPPPTQKTGTPPPKRVRTADGNRGAAGTRICAAEGDTRKQPRAGRTFTLGLDADGP